MMYKPLLKNSFSFICAFLLLLTACKKSSSPDPVDPPVKQPTKEDVTATINTALAGKDTLSQFAAQIKAATLTDAEVKNGITVFAPSNEAYKLKVTSLKRTAETAAEGYLPDSSLVKDYIIAVTIDLATLQSGTTYTALSGKKLTLTKVGNNWYLNGIYLNITVLANDKGTIVFSLAGLLNASTVPHVTGTSDTKTFPGWLLTVYGRNLDTARAKNVVKMDGIVALVHSASTDSLVITVPQGVSAGAISVTVRGRTLNAPQNVTVQSAHVAAIPGVTGGPIQGITVSDDDVVLWTDNFYDAGFVTHPRLGIYKAGQFDYYSPSFPNPNGDGTDISVLNKTALWAITVDHNNKLYYANQRSGQDTVDSYQGIWQSAGISSDQLLLANWWAGSAAVSNAAGTKNQLKVATTAMTIDAQNNIYLRNGASIQKITQNGAVSIFVSSQMLRSADAMVVKDLSSYGLAVSAGGALYISDNANGRVWVRESDGTLRVLAGSNTTGVKDGIGTAAQFGAAFGLTVDKRGNVYVCDNDYNTNKYLIRMINPKGVVTTIAGNASGSFNDGIGTAAGFNGVNSIAVNSKGVLYVGTDAGVVKTITIQ